MSQTDTPIECLVNQRVSDPSEFGDLQLATALRLLRQSGYVLADGDAPADVRLVQQIIDGLCELSSLDVLTGLVNVRQFRYALDQEIDRVSRGGTPVALMMVDADRFKLINDTHGHTVGDLVLQAIARGLREKMRPMDTLARYGGEEFAVILPNCLPQHAVRAGERLRKHIEQTVIEVPAGESVRVTVSVGVACLSVRQKMDRDQFVAAADRQLYLAKAAGRNRVAMDTSVDTAVSGTERAALFNAESQTTDD